MVIWCKNQAKNNKKKLIKLRIGTYPLNILTQPAHMAEFFKNQKMSNSTNKIRSRELKYPGNKIFCPEIMIYQKISELVSVT